MMSNRVASSIAAGCTVVLLTLPATRGAQSPEIDWDDHGISIRWNDTLLTERFQPAIKSAVIETRSINPENNLYDYDFKEAGLADERRTMHAGQGEVHLRHAWGGVRLRYRAQDERIVIHATLDNRTDDAFLANFNLHLLDLHLPDAAGQVQEHGTVRSTLDRPVALGLKIGAGQVFLACETFHPPLHFGLGEAYEDRPGVYPLIARGGVQAEPKDSLVTPHMGLPHVPPGETLELAFSIRFAAADAHRHEVLADFHDAYRAYHDPLLDWPDRRPIGATFLLSENAASPTFGIDGINPRRMGSPALDGIDVFSPHGQVMMRKVFRNFAYRTVGAMTRMNGQGIILWNPEGAYEQAGHYTGSPDMQTILAPEKSQGLDDYFRIVREAGLRTGVGLRPPQLRWNPERKQWNMGAGNANPDADPLKYDFASLGPDHVPWWWVYPIAERLSARIAYAKARWGCTLFYVDTSLVHRPMGVDRRFQAHVMSTHIYRRIRADHPDVLIVPEIYRDRLAYAGHVATYGQTGFGRIRPIHGPDVLRDIFPHYFGFHFIHDTGGNPHRQRPERIHEAVWGEVFAVDGWSIGPGQQAIIGFREQAEDAMRRVSAFARRFNPLRHEDAVLPYPYTLASGSRIPTATIVSDPPGSWQLRIATASSPDRDEAMLIVAWYGWPFAAGTVLRADLPGVDLPGRYRRVWDLETGTQLSRGDRVEVPAAPVHMLRALLVRPADSPAPELPRGLMLALDFDNGLKPSRGDDLLRDHGTVQLGPGAAGRALRVQGGGGTAAYGIVPEWQSGTIEFDLHVDRASATPLKLVRFRRYMDTGLSLVLHNGSPALRLRALEREPHQAHWSHKELAPAPGPPSLREATFPIPQGDGWRHVVLAWDAGLYRLYIDGTSAGVLAPRPAMERWRDGTLFEPGLILGDEGPGEGQARIAAVALYDWSFGSEQAGSRAVGAGRNPLAMPDDLPPRVWMWGNQPGKVEHVAVNWRHTPNGVRARRMRARLYEQQAERLVRLRQGETTSWRGTGVIWVHEDEEAVMATSADLAIDARDGDRLLAGFEDIFAATRNYVLEVHTDAVGEDPPGHRISLTFDLDAPPARYW